MVRDSGCKTERRRRCHELAAAATATVAVATTTVPTTTVPGSGGHRSGTCVSFSWDEISGTDHQATSNGDSRDQRRDRSAQLDAPNPHAVR